jgi:hypothetical protein
VDRRVVAEHDSLTWTARDDEHGVFLLGTRAIRALRD